MDQTNQSKDCFCLQYLGNKELFPDIKSQTVDTLIDNGFDSFPTLMAMDFIEDLPQIPELNFGQKALIRQALGSLQEEYEQNIFDYNNVSQLKDVFHNIYIKLNFKPIIGRKPIHNCYQELDLPKIYANNCLNFGDSTCLSLKVKEENLLKESIQEMGTNIDGTNSPEIVTVPAVDTIEANLTNGSVITSDQSPDGSDFKPNEYLLVKSSMDAIKYEILKKSVTTDVKVLISGFSCDVLSPDSDTQ